MIIIKCLTEHPDCWCLLRSCSVFLCDYQEIIKNSSNQRGVLDVRLNIFIYKKCLMMHIQDINCSCLCFSCTRLRDYHKWSMLSSHINNLLLISFVYKFIFKMMNKYLFKFRPNSCMSKRQHVCKWIIKLN